VNILNALLLLAAGFMAAGPGLLWALGVVDARRERRPR
jgi:hypothetical protein